MYAKLVQKLYLKSYSRPGAIQVREAKWIEKRNVSDQELVMRLNSVLGLGESEAIALAKKIKADLIVLDDDKARKAAISEGLRISGLLAFLVQSKEKGIIKKVKHLMDELRQRNLFISEDLYKDAIQKAGREKSGELL